MNRRAGVLVEHNRERRFIAAEVAHRIVRGAVVTRVPGAALGLTLFEGRVISVFDLGPNRDELLVCEIQGELLALGGLRVLRSGFFEVWDEGVKFEAEPVPALHVQDELELWAQQFWNRRRQAGESS